MKCTCGHSSVWHTNNTGTCLPRNDRCLCATYTPVDPEPAPKEILLGSETWEVTVTCDDCKRTEIMYVPNELAYVPDVGAFLHSRGWIALPDAIWVCPDHGLKSC